MTADGIIEIPPTGQAWQGDWRTRARERLWQYGFDSFAALARSFPTASLVELAVQLSTVYSARTNYSDIAAVQVSALWLEEANKSGAEAVEYMARHVLVGELNRALPEGWFRGWPVNDASDVESPMWRLIRASSSWSAALNDANKDASYRIFAAIKERSLAGAIPVGWLPADADDPLISELFVTNWRSQP
jgi:hypothetical protein